LRARSASDRLVLVVSIVVFIDTMMYAVITPMLPRLSHQLHPSKLSAGVMTAGYAAGMLAASLPGGALAVRRGPRVTVVAGLILLAISTVGVGLLDSAPGIDAARFVEGVGGACSWAGGMAWIVAATPLERRGSVLGKALGTAIAGALFGPAVGALASAIGRPALFCVLAALALLLLVPVRMLPDGGESSEQSVTEVVSLMRKPSLVVAMWLMALPAIVSGAYNVLAPLQLHVLGAGAAAIGATFLVGAAAEAAVSAPVGRFSDRRGRSLPLRFGLIGVAVATACFTLPSSAIVLSLLLVATFMMVGVFWAPVMALVSDVADAAGIDQAHAAALMNLAWAGGQIVGSACGGATAKAFGDSFPTLCTAGLCLLTLAALRQRSLARGPAPARDLSA
jgi:predicted MFS family arabinose efflux permease